MWRWTCNVYKSILQRRKCKSKRVYNQLWFLLVCYGIKWLECNFWFIGFKQWCYRFFLWFCNLEYACSEWAWNYFWHSRWLSCLAIYWKRVWRWFSNAISYDTSKFKSQYQSNQSFYLLRRFVWYNLYVFEYRRLFNILGSNGCTKCWWI